MNRYVRAARRTLAAGVTTTAVLALTTAASAAANPAQPQSAAKHAPACSAADLGAWLAIDAGSGAAGSIYYPLQLTNLSRHACTLRGFARVAAISRTGRQLGSPARRDYTAPERTEWLAPAATAHATLRYSDIVVGDCPAASRRPAFELAVTPPGRRRPTHALFGLDVCAAKRSVFMSVSAIKPGPGTASG